MEAIVKTNFNFKGQNNHYVGKVRDVYSIDGDYLVMAPRSAQRMHYGRRYSSPCTRQNEQEK